jgi:hypothetical protein
MTQATCFETRNRGQILGVQPNVHMAPWASPAATGTACQPGTVSHTACRKQLQCPWLRTYQLAGVNYCLPVHFRRVIHCLLHYRLRAASMWVSSVLLPQGPSAVLL